MSFQSIQNSLIAGELSPSIYGRTDLAKYHLGASTMRNMFVSYRGGAYSRPGMAFIGKCKQSGTAYPPRDITFQFNNNQGFELEFGDQYMRVKSNGAYVTETGKTITGATNANPCTLHIVGHGFSAGDDVYISGVGGMIALNGLIWHVNTVPDADHITLKDMWGAAVNSTAWGVYTSGGTAARIYTLTTPYAAVDLPYLKYVQSADTMTLDCVNQETGTEYPPYSLVRTGAASYTLTTISYASAISAPTGIGGSVEHPPLSASVVLDTYYSYVVTSVDANGEESIASSAVSLFNVDIAIIAGTNKITWNPVDGGVYYKIFKATPSYNTQTPLGVNYGYCGTAFGTSFVDTNITADFTIVPPTHKDPFARGQITAVVPTAGGAGYDQTTVGYTITTATGSGFVGTPLVLSGAFAGFLVENGGSGYLPGDTIAITGGGATKASGTYTFTGNPVAGNNINLGGTVWTFVAAGAVGNQTNIKATVQATVYQLIADLTLSADVNIATATYGASGLVVTITYATTGAAGNAYTLASGTYGGTVSGPHLTGGADAGGASATATLTIGPNTGTYPSVPAYLFQRALQANTQNNPDTYFMSKPGQYTNMDSSIPVTAGDAIIGNPWAQQINGIQFVLPMLSAAIMFTGGGTWLLSGGSLGAAFTAASQQATPQEYNGISSTVPPLQINADILYVQSLDGTVRDLAYNFFTNRATSTDITLLSSHLFQDKQIIQWCYAQDPFKVAWCVRNDGTALSLTYIKEQEVEGWARHDTNGQFIGVTSVTEPPVNAVYWITKRYVNGGWHYFSERFDNRDWVTAEDCFCVDAGLAYPKPTPNATLTPSGTTGTITLTASVGVFSAGNVGDVVRVGGGICTITDYISTTSVTATVTQTITNTIPNDPENTPFPVASGDWTMTTPITRVTGLNHLIGKTVQILADGSVVDDQTVVAFDDGTVGITLPTACSSITVGLAFLPQLQTMYLDPPSQMTTQTKRKTINAVAVRVEKTRGISVGANQPDQATQPNGGNPAWTNMTEVKMRNATISAGQPIPLETGDFYLPILGGWSTKAQVAIQQNYPLPANISAVVINYNIGDTSG